MVFNKFFYSLHYTLTGSVGIVIDYDNSAFE